MITSHQAQILEKRGISELYILCRHELWDTEIRVLRLKTNFLNSSPNESIPKFTNISLALLYFGKPSNLRKLLL